MEFYWTKESDIPVIKHYHYLDERHPTDASPETVRYLTENGNLPPDTVIQCLGCGETTTEMALHSGLGGGVTPQGGGING